MLPMTKNRLPRLAAAALIAGVAFSSTLPAAFAAPSAVAPGAVTAVHEAFGAGYNNVLNGQAAAYRIVKTDDGASVRVYCLQLEVDYRETTFSSVTRAAVAGQGIDNIGKAGSIAVTSATVGTPLADAKSEAAATQLAIWQVANGADVSSVNNAAIRDRAAALVAGAGDIAEGPSSFVLTADAELNTEASTNVVTARLTTGEGTAIAGEDLELVVAGTETVATTDAEGDVTFEVPATTDPLAGTVTFEGVLPAGSVLAPSEGQVMVTAEDAPVKRVAEVDLAALVPVVETPAPTPTPVVTPEVTPPVVETPAPAPTPVVTPETIRPQDERPDQLAYTGTWVTGSMVGLAAALVVGGYFLRRRLANR